MNFKKYLKLNKFYSPVLQTIPSPVYPLGQGGQVAPVPGAGTSVHVASLKHDTSVQPSKSSSQYSPSYAIE